MILNPEKLKQFILKQRTNEIKPVSKNDLHFYALSACADQGVTWKPTMTEPVILECEQAERAIDRENAEKVERESRETEKQVEGTRKELVGMVKQIRCWQTPWGDRVEVDGKMEWQRLSISVMGDETVRKRTRESVCLREGEKLDLSSSLDYFLNDLARNIVSGSINKPSLLELDRMLSNIDPLEAHCGIESANECLGVKSELGDHCHTISLKLVAK